MKERVIYNTYYPEFEDFKSAVFGFFSTLTTLGVESVLGQDFRSRVRDKFRPIAALSQVFKDRYKFFNHRAHRERRVCV